MSNQERTLDWVPRYDERSRNFSAVAGIESSPLRSYSWTCDAYLNQGSEGACVGFGWSDELCARPAVHMVDDAFAFALYNRAKELDQWAGVDYDGTSVLAGAKAVKEQKNSKGLPLIGSYRWAFGVEDVMRTLAYRGPVVLGINWYDNMYDPDGKNYIHAAGPIAGGHCILANGVYFKKHNPDGPRTFANINPDVSRIRVHNSWGKDWGINSEAFMTITDLQKLLDDDGGEACIPSQRTV